jgi:integrase/recombinase XerC
MAATDATVALHRDGGFDPAADVEAFLQHLAVVRRLSDNTLAAYRRDLQRLLAFLNENALADWRALDPEHLRGLVAREHRRGLSGKSQLLPLAAARWPSRWQPGRRTARTQGRPQAALGTRRGCHRRLPRRHRRPRG